MDYFKSFKSYLQYEKRSSPHTVISYIADLSQFFNYLEEHEVDFPNGVQSTHIRSWLTSLTLSEFKPSSINRKLSSIRTFFRFLKQRNGFEGDPLKYVKGLKKGARIPVVVKEREMAALYSEMEDNKTDFVILRDFMCLDMMYSTGMRRGELTQIKLGDINKSRSVVRIKGKGGKTREIPLSPKLMDTIDKYLNLRNTQSFEVDHDFLLVTNKGRPIYEKFIYTLVKKYLGRVSSVARKSPHVLRHSFATHLTENGAPLSALRDLLGHSSLASTEIYLHHSMKKIKSIYKEALPRQTRK